MSKINPHPPLRGDLSQSWRLCSFEVLMIKTLMNFTLPLGGSSAARGGLTAGRRALRGPLSGPSGRLSQRESKAARPHHTGRKLEADATEVQHQRGLRRRRKRPLRRTVEEGMILAGVAGLATTW